MDRGRQGERQRGNKIVCGMMRERERWIGGDRGRGNKIVFNMRERAREREGETEREQDCV